MLRRRGLRDAGGVSGDRGRDARRRAAHVRGRRRGLRLHRRASELDARDLRAVPADREPLLLDSGRRDLARGRLAIRARVVQRAGAQSLRFPAHARIHAARDGGAERLHSRRARRRSSRRQPLLRLDDGGRDAERRNHPLSAELSRRPAAVLHRGAHHGDSDAGGMLRRASGALSSTRRMSSGARAEGAPGPCSISGASRSSGSSAGRAGTTRATTAPSSRTPRSTAPSMSPFRAWSPSSRRGGRARASPARPRCA